MKGIVLLRTALLLLLISAAQSSVSAQDEGLLKVRSANVDGGVYDWKTTQIQYNSTTKLSYAIENDRSYLYILVKSADQPTNSKILANSFRISINSKGKKRAVTSLTFPLIDRDALIRSRQGRPNGNERPVRGADVRNGTLSDASTMKIDGFPRIPDGTFSLQLVNTYGIKAIARFDENKVLIYELSIPLSQLDIVPGQKKAIACQLKINGSPDSVEDPSNYPDNRRIPGGNGGIPTGGGMIPGIGTRGLPGMGGTVRIGRGTQRPASRPVSQLEKDKFNTKSASFWVKYPLAKTKV